MKKYRIIVDNDIKSKNPIHYELYIYKTSKSMSSGIVNFYKRNNIDHEYEHLLGMVHPMKRYKNIAGELIDSGLFAVVYLNEQHLGTRTLSHEILHLSLAYERYILGEHCFYGDECGDDEERLCSIHGDQMALIVNLLHEEGFYSMEDK